MAIFPLAAFCFWEQAAFKSILSEIMDKSAFYKFQLKGAGTQRITYVFFEAHRLRQKINILNKQFSGYGITKSLCKIKCSSIKRCSRNHRLLNVILHRKAINYYGLYLADYKAIAEIIYDRFVNVNIVYIKKQQTFSYLKCYMTIKRNTFLLR